MSDAINFGVLPLPPVLTINIRVVTYDDYSVSFSKPEPQIKENSTGRTTLFLAPFVVSMCLLEHEGSGKTGKVFLKVNPRMYR